MTQVNDEQQKTDTKAQGAFRTISEVADHLSVQQHVLRFWETKFSQVKPLTRGGGRRYYRPEDVAVLEKIHTILYKEGYTIKGAQKLLKGLSKGQIGQLSLQKVASEQSNVPITAQAHQQGLSTHQKAVLEIMLNDLTDLRDLLKK
jgi:DNA-binding transcriptional MerR regulator